VTVAWGSVPDWVAGVGAAVGLGFAGWEIRRSREQREHEASAAELAEAERRETMARSVGVRAEVANHGDEHEPRWMVSYKVFNGGSHPISAAVLIVLDPGSDEPDPAAQRGNALEDVIGTILPGETIQEGPIQVEFEREPVFGELTHLGGLLFMDVWGQTWFSRGTDLEKRDHMARIC